MGYVVVGSLAVLSKGAVSEYILLHPDLDLLLIFQPLDSFAHRSRDCRYDSLTGKNQEQNIGPFFPQGQRAGRPPNLHHLPLPRKVPLSVRLFHP